MEITASSSLQKWMYIHAGVSPAIGE